MRKISTIEPELYRRPEKEIPSRGGVGSARMIEERIYTGNLIQGVATMHKSNGVPVINKDVAKDLAQMRR